MRDAPFRFRTVPTFAAAALLALAGCGGGSSTGGTAGSSGSAGNSGGTAGNSGGTAGNSGGTAGNSGGTAGTSGGTAGTSGGTAGNSGGTAGSTGGTATGTAGNGAAGNGSAGNGAAGNGSAGNGSAGNGNGGRGGGAAGRGGTGGTGTGGTGTGGTTGTGGSSATQTSTNVTLYHNNLARTGVYVDAALTQAAVKTLHVDTSFANTAITGPVYAQPLYLGGAGTSQPDTVVVATATNRVYALNATTGAEVWANMQYGAPITSKLDITGSNQPLNPMGVVGTPVIDPATRTLYFSAMTNVSNGARHRIHAVDLSNGMEKTGWPVIVETAATNADVGAFKAPDQNQRAALAVLGGRLFVPYSGHIGDAGPYHGWVVGVSTTAPTDVKTWATRATGGGIWGTSGIASDGTSIFFVTGNTMAAANGGSFMAPGNYGDGESVFKLSPSLTRISTMGASTDFFMPSDWGPLDNGDTDLGGTGIILFDVPGATPSGLILALGKDGYAYLLNRANLGGENATPLAKVKVSSRQIIQAAVVFTTSTGTYFVFRGSVQGCPTGMSGGLMAVKISGATLTPVWCGGPTGASNPIVSMSNAQGADAMLWVVATSGQVSAFVVDNSWASAFTGTVTATGTVKGHQSPIVANGRVYVQTDNRTYLLRP